MIERVLLAIRAVVTVAYKGNILLWTKGFGAAWNRISLTEKFIWLFFLSNTIALITVIEFLLMKK